MQWPQAPTTLDDQGHGPQGDEGDEQDRETTVFDDGTQQSDHEAFQAARRCLTLDGLIELGLGTG